MNNFVYHVPTKVYFGQNQLEHLGAELRAFGKKVLLCYGGGSIKKMGLYDKIVREIKAAGLTLFELSGIDPNPRVSSVRSGAKICKQQKIDVILAAGGGSVLDCAKFIGMAAFYDGDAWDILTDKAGVTQCLPLVTVLTAAAAGSEMDPTGVISNPDTNDKLGWGHPSMRPAVSFLDPQNTYTVNAFQTACGAADIVSHILEEYFYPGEALYMLDTVMEGLLKTVIKFAPIALAQPDNYEARANLMWASSWAINGFIGSDKTQAWSCHPIEHELSAFYDITHGLGLAIVTPRFLTHILKDKATLPRFRAFGEGVFGLSSKLSDEEIARQSIARLSAFFCSDLKLAGNLTALNIDSTHFKTMAKKACQIGGLAHAFSPLNANDVEEILIDCL